MDLWPRVEVFACEPVVLIATDYDGTIAQIVDHPADAKPDENALLALGTLARIPQTHVAIISGRPLSDLALHFGKITNLQLVGCHGIEFGNNLSGLLSDRTKALLQRISIFLNELARGSEGLYVEEKPASVALHYRNADEKTARSSLDAVLKGPALWPGVHVHHGKMVIELRVVEANKGAALQHIRKSCGATAVLFIGDDATDEDAFVTLDGTDLGIRVGAGPTAARFSVKEPQDVSQILATVCHLRTGWISRTRECL